jgi:hypothetical protein
MNSIPKPRHVSRLPWPTRQQFRRHASKGKAQTVP